MERLTRTITKKDIEAINKFYKESGLNVVSYSAVGDYTLKEEARGTNAPIIKLGKLEDIEEGFGIDLIKLLTAEEIYYKANGKIESYSFDVDFNAQLILIRIYHSPYPKDTENFTFGFNSYGKTWAFTKEELEK